MECIAKDNKSREIITNINHSPPEDMNQCMNGTEENEIILCMSDIDL